jgi:hypothetical protein
VGAGHGSFHFLRNSLDFHPVKACRSGDGLGITHERSATASGRYARWVAQAPPGTFFTRGQLTARGLRGGGYRPRLLLHRLGAAGLDPFGAPRASLHSFAWRAGGGANRLVAQLACIRHGHDCGKTHSPALYIRHAHFQIFDLAVPTVTHVGGPLLNAPVQRGTQGLTVSARDVGSGLREVLVRANHQPFKSVGLDCAVNRRHELALGLSPCPNSVTRTPSIDTQLQRFHEGQNAITVCVDDYANASPNERCAQRRIRVDNDCPISDVKAPTAARFAFTGGKASKRVKFGGHPRVVGRLATAAGAPGAGALVCISERPALNDSVEKLVGRPLRSDQRGRVSTRLPGGPSRIVYLTYWRGAEQVVTRAAHLRVAPRVRLRVRPRGKLRNGQTVTLRAKLGGPFHAHRKLQFLAKPPGGHWVPFSRTFAKRTHADGVARISHTFRHVFGTEVFRFKVEVPPHQAGYPYVRGQSHVRKKAVTAR